MKRMKGMFAVTAAVSLLQVGVVLFSGCGWNGHMHEAEQILEITGIRGGFVVHLGCGNGGLTTALHPNDSYLVHGLDMNPENIEQARILIDSHGLYGKVSVEKWDKRYLPYTDNLVNLFVSEDLGGIPMEEVMRVLTPDGVACLKENGSWRKTVKPRPPDIDEWTHALYDASNNAVAHDNETGPPEHLQWVGGPKFSRHHNFLSSISAVVSANGRIFSVLDEGSRMSLFMPAEWHLVARDAFNGTILWKRDIASWGPVFRSFASGPPELSRRLVAVGEKVYVTLSLDAPLTCLDAATGKNIRTYDGTEGTDEVLWHDGRLYIVIGNPASARLTSSIGLGHYSVAPAEREELIAVDAESGNILWKKTGELIDHLLPLGLAAGDGNLFFQNEKAIFCLDNSTGEEQWRFAREFDFESRPGWSSPTLVVSGDVILSADRNPNIPPNIDKNTGEKRRATGSGDGELIALSVKTGKELWRTVCTETLCSPHDVFVSGGLAWTGHTKGRGQNSIDFTAGYDLHTGEIKKEIYPEEAFTVSHHHRCYRNRATDRYIVMGRTGIEFIDLTDGESIRHNWVRGACQYGILPCNGLLYAPPSPCACYIESKLSGFYALAPARKHEVKRPEEVRLEHGNAYGSIRDKASKSAHTGEWPTYRHDAARSGYTQVPVSSDLNLSWQAHPGGKLSSPVIAAGVVIVAQVDEHSIKALDEKSGDSKWSYTAGGRIDSPPTIYKGKVLFGSADGWIYCCRLSDGELVWRFRASPEDRRVVSYGQIESAWPVHGSVLVQDEIVYCAAGRSSYLDGGIYLYRLDVNTGEKLTEKLINSRDPQTGKQPEEKVLGLEMPGAFADVLSSDGERVYMRHLAYNVNTLQNEKRTSHLFSSMGFLNDIWWHRTFWIYGTRFHSGWHGWHTAAREVPAGRILVFDESSVYGFGRKPGSLTGSVTLQMQLFAADRNAVKFQEPVRETEYWDGVNEILRRNKDFTTQYLWTNESEGERIMLARAMVLADGTLFTAGPMERVNMERPVGHNDKPETRDRIEKEIAGFEKSKEGLLCAFSAEDGRKIAEYELDVLPVFDGLAAANGRLYMSTTDGKVVCLGEEGKVFSKKAGIW